MKCGFFLCCMFLQKSDDSGFGLLVPEEAVAVVGILDHYYVGFSSPVFKSLEEIRAV